MPVPSSPDRRQLIEVATLYYVRELTQQQIADRLSVSRPKVSRLLKRARDEGIVQISIAASAPDLELGVRLEKRFGLDGAIVVDPSGDHTATLGAAAAAFLLRTVKDGDVVGFTLGPTMQAMARALPDHPTSDVRVVQAAGCVAPPDIDAHAAGISHRIANQLGAALTLLTVPLVVGSPEVRDLFTSEPSVEQALSLLSQVSTLYTGIDSLSTNHVLDEKYRVVSRADVRELEATGAVGDIALRFIDASGHRVETSLDDRTIGITLDQIRHVPRVVCVDGGPDKRQAILAALRGEYVNVLISDRSTAVALVESDDSGS